MSKEKAKAVIPTKKEIKKIIKEKQEMKIFGEEDLKFKDLVDTQRAYRIKVKQRLLKQAELGELQAQLGAAKEKPEEYPKIQWYGMPMPIPILGATYNLGLESYQSIVVEEKELRRQLSKKYFLQDEEIDKVLEGEYVKELRKK